MDGRTAAIQWLQWMMPLRLGAKNQLQLVFSISFSQGTIPPRPGLIELVVRWDTVARSIGNAHSQESEAGLHGKLPHRAT